MSAQSPQGVKFVLLLWVVAIFALIIVSGCSSAPEEQVKSNVQYLKSTNELTYLKIGKEVTDSVGAVLKANLMQAMGEGGPIHAVEFCNTQAMPLTDSFNQKYNAEVKRTSDRLRNPDNAPNATEAQVIADYRAEQASGMVLTTKLAIDAMGRRVFYAPIFTGAPCLICHGNEGNMDEGLRSKLMELYPDDNAKGFNIDELRGIWSVLLVKG
jgi:hypothetical protein